MGVAALVRWIEKDKSVIAKLMRGAALGLVAVLCACGGGDAPGAPTGLALEAGEGRVTVTWDQLSGLDYYVWWKAGSSIVARDDNALGALHKVNSPLVVSSWTRYVNSVAVTSYFEDATQYAFVMNATQGGGKAGPSSEVKTVTTRYAGASWTKNSAAVLGATTLTDVTFDGTDLFLAVGAGGKLFSSTSGLTWSAVTPSISPTVSSNLNSVMCSGDADSDGHCDRYLVVGDSGTILTNALDSDEVVTWTNLTASTLTTANLNKVILGSSLYVAVGDGGTILTSSDGLTWAAQTVGSENLYDVAYLNSVYLAVGAKGTLLTSADGLTWTAVTSGTSNDLRGLAFGKYVDSSETTTYYFVAVGAAGTVLTNTSTALTSTTLSAAWTLQAAPPGSPDLYSLAYGAQFMAIGSNGAVVYGRNPTAPSSWTTGVSGVTALSRVRYMAAPSQYAYIALGASGALLGAR